MADSLLSQRRMLTQSPRDKEGNRIRGMGIRSAGEAAAEQEYMGRYAAGMAELQRRSMLSALRESEMRPGQPGTQEQKQSGTQEQKQSAPLSARDQLAKDRESRMAYYARIQGQAPTAAEPAPTRSRYRDQLDALTARNETESQRAAMTERVMQGGSAALAQEASRISNTPTLLERERLRRGPAAPAQNETLAQMRASTQSLLRMPRPQNPALPAPEQAGPVFRPEAMGPAAPAPTTAAAPAAPSLLRGGTTREDAQKRVDAARASGTLPSYQDRMIAGGITIDDIKSGVGSLVSGAGSLLKKARAGVDRTNAWADSVRNRINK